MDPCEDPMLYRKAPWYNRVGPSLLRAGVAPQSGSAESRKHPHQINSHAWFRLSLENSGNVEMLKIIIMLQLRIP